MEKIENNISIQNWGKLGWDEERKERKKIQGKTFPRSVKNDSTFVLQELDQRYSSLNSLTAHISLTKSRRQTNNILLNNISQSL